MRSGGGWIPELLNILNCPSAIGKQKSAFLPPVSLKWESQTCHLLRTYLGIILIAKETIFLLLFGAINDCGARGVATVFYLFRLFFQAGTAFQNLREVESKSYAIIRWDHFCKWALLAQFKLQLALKC